jgi:hypothetical protein
MINLRNYCYCYILCIISTKYLLLRRKETIFKMTMQYNLKSNITYFQRYIKYEIVYLCFSFVVLFGRLFLV